ncbi:IS30 family transposase [Weissella uvarum]|uniref:IS30 family transposase n=1 Tax=Weissella uvarum TaxID=1479233 RepID=UPI001960FB1A|nr:IS30 family transposase [Weissella uvarum]MBM7617403.1 IS30 family transposase [Weissella uvarum]MCM0595712.1 IS30 family transposase [Weissella uvarum]
MGKHLTFEDRVLLEHYWNVEQKSMTEIADLMGRSQSSISRELYKGSETDLSTIPKRVLNKNLHGLLKYSARQAQYYKQKANGNRRGSRNLTYAWQKKIELYLNQRGYSPEDFVYEFPGCPMSVATIRNYIAKGYINVSKTAYGRRSTKHKKTPERATKAEVQASMENLNAKIERGNRNTTSSIQVKRLTIEDRPASVENRRQFGHWEMDLVVARDGTYSAVIVFVERKTRYMVAVRLGQSRKADAMIAGLDYFMNLHGQFVRSITLDNGIEFISWDFLAHIQQDFGVKMYFAHPNSPQERGTNERRNRDLRHIVGYGDYESKTQLDWDKACEIANRKPMRIALDGETPRKMYHQECLARLRQIKRAKSSPAS